MSKKIQSDSPSLAAEILDAIAKIDRPADFCTSGPCLMVLPGLDVSGVGDIGLPLTATEAKRLIKVCRQAPYGKGTETVVDTKVRKVWELDPKQFSLKNPKWPLMLDLILRDVETNLGLPKKKLAAHLYKLLVYEKGGFFLPHRDGEKLDRMVATLVINLPSKHSGGELVVHHEGRQVTISLPGAAAGLEVEYAAFYADCQHEVKPLLSGYRLCLTYNLVLSKAQRKSSVTAPIYKEVTDSLAATLKKWSNDTNSLADAPTKLAVMLEHRYTQEGLLIDQLKGVDLAQANVLFDAAETANCDAFLALITLWQSGSAEGEYDDYGYGNSRRNSRYDEEDEEDNDSAHSSGHTMGEVYESSLSADNWSNRHGKKIAFGNIPLDESEIVSIVELMNTDPSREDFEGYTGNAGMTLERWYHRAAIVIWPRSQQLQVWREAGTDAAIAGLGQMIAGLKKAKKSNREEKLEQCRELAMQTVQNWRPAKSSNYWETGEKSETKRESIFDSLEELNEAALVNHMIEGAMPKDANLTFPKQFVSWMAKQGWAEFTDSLKAMVMGSSEATLARNIKIVREIATLRDSNSDQMNLCKQLTLLIVQAIEKLDADAPNRLSFARWDRTEIVVDMVTALASAGDQESLARFLSWQGVHSRYELTDVQIPAATKLAPLLKKTSGKNRAIQNWVKDLRTELQLRTKSEPKKPSDWKRDSKLSCACSDCSRLAQFLADPTQQEARFPLAKARRQHLHNTISRDECDCTHQTLRVGSPQVLVCKKTTANYDQACKVYEQDLKHLSFILSLEST